MSSSAFTLELLEARDVPASLNEAFVTQLYQDLLYRAPDAAGLAFGVGLLETGVAREDVALIFLNSPEFLIIAAGAQFQKFLDRPATAEEVTVAATFLATGGNIDFLRAFVISSDEAFQRAGGTNEAWLESAFQFALKRPLDSAAGEIGQALLANGLTRFQLVVALLQSEEGDKASARHLYNDYLRRGPDPVGFPAWWMALNRGVSEVTVTANFLATAEFVTNATSTRYRDIIALIW